MANPRTQKTELRTRRKRRPVRQPAYFIKALALGADAIALSNSAMQAIGCIAMRACHTNNCPVGIASQKPHLVSRLVVDQSAQRLKNFFDASVLMQVMSRACAHKNYQDSMFLTQAPSTKISPILPACPTLALAISET